MSLFAYYVLIGYIVRSGYTVFSMSTEPAAPQPSSYWSGYEMLWGLRAPTRRTALDRLQIVDAAIAIADGEGLAAVTMRKVARALHCAPMSLYRHIPDKEALVSMMVDRAIETSRRSAESESTASWRDGLELVAMSIWRLCRAHPWFAEASMARPPITPNGIAGFEHALSLFDGLPVDVTTTAQFVSTIFSTVVASAFSLAMNEAARLRAQLSERQLYAEAAPVFAQIVHSGAYPRVADFLANASHRDDEAQMRARVELILDGIATRLAAGARPGSRPRDTGIRAGAHSGRIAQRPASY